MNKTILITGSGSGIGRDVAFALAARGHRVLAATLDESQAAALRSSRVGDDILSALEQRARLATNRRAAADSRD